MPSRADAPFLQGFGKAESVIVAMLYQCPFGLGLHFYKKKESMEESATRSINALSGWGFISTRRLRLMYDAIVIVSMPFRAKAPFLLDPTWEESVAASASYQCPFGLKLHFYRNKWLRMDSSNYVSMPFRAVAPFLPHVSQLL